MLNGTQCKFDQRSPRGESQQVNKSQEQAKFLVPMLPGAQGSSWLLVHVRTEARGQRQGTVATDITFSFYSGVSVGDNRVKDFAWQRLSALDLQV